MAGGYRTIARDLGRMLQALAVLMAASILVPLVWMEFYAVGPLAVSALLTGVTGTAFARRYADADEPGKLHGMMIAASGWLLVALFGSLPLVLLAWTAALSPLGIVPASVDTPTLAAFQSPLNAFFESMSGFTGTGLTMVDHEPVLPRTVQWWRSAIEWVGGVGVIVLTTAILARPGSGSLTLYESEARSEKIHPSVLSTVRTIWWIFILFTFVATALLWLAGMPPWDALNHAMTGLSTGGFSVTDASIGSYDSAVIDFAMVPVMIAGSIAFPIHYLILQGDLRNFYADLQTRWVFGFFLLGSVALVGVLLANDTYATEQTVVAGGALVLSGQSATIFETVRYGLFQFVSSASCTGFGTAGASATGLGDWPVAAQLTMSLGMGVGAAAGSTVGGIKLIRAATLIKGTAFRINGIFYPSTAVRYFELGGRRLSEAELSREFEEAAIISFLWVAFFAVGLAVVLGTVAPSFSLGDVVFEVASAQGNVGLTTGITGPSMPTLTKVTFLFNMWIGRLEIIPVLVLLRSVFARGGLYE